MWNMHHDCHSSYEITKGEYKQEISQPHTAEQTMKQRRKITATWRQAKQPASSLFHSKMISKQEKDTKHVYLYHWSIAGSF